VLSSRPAVPYVTAVRYFCARSGLTKCRFAPATAVWSAKTTFRHCYTCSRTVRKRFRMFGIPEGPNICGAQEY
jgi:hypothetical protein